MKLTNPQTATLLAALRHWQQHLERGDTPFEMMIADDMGGFAPLSSRQIDEMCDRLQGDEGDELLFEEDNND